jgi:transcriptional regulator with GAF, ATPase, and Fis domain
METSHRSRLVLEVTELAQALQRQQAPDLDSVLGELTDTAVRAVPSAEYAGITLATGDGEVRTAAATGRYPVLLDELQQRHHQGPGLSAAREGQMIHIDDMGREQRWRRFCRDAAARTPIRSVLSFQLFADPQTVGALSFYAEQPDVFDDEAVEIGLVLATHTALTWNLVRRDEQFRRALASRDIIGQAKGMIMERFSVDAVQAFELLNRLSQSSNTPLVAVARQLVETQHPSDDRPPARQ